MAPNADADTASKSTSKKKRKSKKKNTDKSDGKANGTANVEDINETVENEEDDDEGEDEPGHEADTSRNTSVTEGQSKMEALELPTNGSRHTKHENERKTLEQSEHSEITARLDAAEKERDALKEEVSSLRKSLEELSTVKDELDQAQAAKEKADSQYQTLLGRVNTIRSQLGERLKADAEELSHAREEIEQLEKRNAENRRAQEEKDQIVSRLEKELEAQKEEMNSLRSRSNLSTTNWSKERDDLNSQLAYAKEEFENAKQAMQDWEVLAMEERSLRESLGERVAEIEDQASSNKDAYERTANERDVLNSTVEGLQRALQEIQEARRTELRETVESSQAQLEVLKKKADEAARNAADAAAKLETTQKELERALPFEKEVKEKNLLIGKLRHEAVILNDHLTKALRFLKRGRPEDNVDRQIVTNHFIQFLALDRADPKKFQVLHLIAALLGWTDEQRERAGLARPGASNAQLRVPLSPFRRTPSTPSLSTDFVDNPAGGHSQESLAELWSDFLQRESEVAAGGSKTASRRGSVTASQRSFSLASPPAPRSEGPGLGIRASISGGATKPHPPLPEEDS